LTNINQIWLEWYLGGALTKLGPTACPPFKMAAIYTNFVNCHLECRETLVDTILKGEETIPVNFGLIWFIFRGKI
jgi:hypothetical protein